MAIGNVDGTVRNRVKGEAILSALLAISRPGTVIRVSRKLAKVDKSASKRYTRIVGARGEGQVSED